MNSVKIQGNTTIPSLNVRGVYTGTSVSATNATITNGLISDTANTAALTTATLTSDNTTVVSLTAPTLSLSNLTVANLNTSNITCAGSNIIANINTSALSNSGSLTVAGSFTTPDLSNTGKILATTATVGKLYATSLELTPYVYTDSFRRPTRQLASTTFSTVSANVSSSELLKGQLINSYTGSSATWNLPSAVSLGISANFSWRIIIVNKSSFALTLVNGTDMTVYATSIPASYTAFFTAVYDGAFVFIFPTSEITTTTSIANMQTASNLQLDSGAFSNVSVASNAILNSITLPSNFSTSNITSTNVNVGSSLTILGTTVANNMQQPYDTTITTTGTTLLNIETCKNQYFDITDSASTGITINMISGWNLVKGRQITLIFKDSRVGGRVVSFDSNIKAPAGLATAGSGNVTVMTIVVILPGLVSVRLGA